MAVWTWLITGASSGLGAQLAIAALNAGHRVVATARSINNAKIAYPAIERMGGRWMQLDVTSPDTESLVARAVQEHGITVIVNNAGYALRNVLEDASMEQIRAQMETNFFGCVAVAKGAIPFFRERKFGVIVNISSTSGMVALPGYGLYAASKFALEGMAEALAAELSPFNIRVLIVQLGAYRTNFQSSVDGAQNGTSENYRGTSAETTMRKVSAMHGRQPGDPTKAAQAIVDVTTQTGRGESLGAVLRLPLGCDAIQKAHAKIESFQADVEKCRDVSEWAVYDNGAEV